MTHVGVDAVQSVDLSIVGPVAWTVILCPVRVAPRWHIDTVHILLVEGSIGWSEVRESCLTREVSKRAPDGGIDGMGFLSSVHCHVNNLQ